HQVCKQADEHRQPCPVVVQKGLEAALSGAFSRQELLIDKQGRHRSQPQKIEAAKFGPLANQQENQPHQSLQNGNDGAVGAAKQNSGVCNAYLEIVVPVDDGVKRIVGNRPQDVSGEQQPGQLAQLARLSGPGHGDCPGKSRTQEQLRQV